MLIKIGKKLEENSKQMGESKDLCKNLEEINKTNNQQMTGLKE